MEHADILKIDRAITTKLVGLALAKGYSLSVLQNDDDADNIIKSHDANAVLEALHAVDEERLYIHDAQGKRLGWVNFIFGEYGWDVIQDYTTGAAISELIDEGPIKAITDGICDNPEHWTTILAMNGAVIP